MQKDLMQKVPKLNKKSTSLQHTNRPSYYLYNY